MIRRLALWTTAALFLFWLVWPRAWLPRRWAARERAAEALLPGLGIRSADAAAGGPLRPAPVARSSDQVAVLLAGPAQSSFAAEVALRAAGLPYTVERDAETAYARRIVLVPADDEPMRLGRAGLDRLTRFVAEGGTLIVQATALAPWPEVTGVAAVIPSRERRSIAFRPGDDEGFAGLVRPEELTVPLAAPASEEGPWTGGLVLRRGQAEAIATFPDTKETAISRRTIGSGRVYVLGADLRDLVVRPRAGRAFDAQRAPSNAFDPGADAWPRLLAAWYQTRTPDWVRLRARPGDAKGLLLLSHAIESGVSPAEAREWAVWESSRGLRSTWFVQTNHSDGGQEGPFYDAALGATLREIAALGHEIAAHTVVHAADFETLPRGDGLERRKDYRPATEGGRSWGATRLGEIRVPKEILEKDLPGRTVAGFRAPAFAFPADLDSALAAAGYAYDSSRPAAAALSHRPFLLTRGRGLAAESRVVELAMTFEDESPDRTAPPSAPEILRVARAVFASGGVVVWQSRPSREGLRRLSEVVAGLPPGTRVGTLGEAARWWSARERVRFWTEPAPDGRGRVLRLLLPREADGADLSFETAGPAGACLPLTPGLEADCSGRTIVIRRTGGAREAALVYALPSLK